MSSHLEPWDLPLVAALGVERPAHTLADLAAETGAPAALIEGLVRAELVVPVDGLFTATDRETVATGMALLAVGIPLAELLDLARRAHERLAPLADDAVELFLRFVRDAAAAGGEGGAPGRRLLDAFAAALPASERLVAGHFRSLVLAEARRRAAS